MLSIVDLGATCRTRADATRFQGMNGNQWNDSYSGGRIEHQSQS